MNENSEFIGVEYQEACKAYFHGVLIGQSFLRLFILVQSILFSSYILFKGLGLIITDFGIALYAPGMFGLLLSGMVFAFAPKYDRYLDMISERCADLEASFDGKLFTRIHKVSAGSVGLSSTSGARVVAVGFAIIWAIFLIQLL